MAGGQRSRFIQKKEFGITARLHQWPCPVNRLQGAGNPPFQRDSFLHDDTILVVQATAIPKQSTRFRWVCNQPTVWVYPVSSRHLPFLISNSNQTF
jgi:hypothetical protein